jgi:ABC-type transporter Mla MlaB component
MGNTRKDKKPANTTVVIKGDATIAAVGRLKKELTEALAAAQEVQVQLQNITAVDVTLLQLLCAAHRSAAEQKKGLTVTGGKQELFAQLLRKAGFLRHMGCRENDRKACLWIDTLQR